jgi:septum formation protein
MIRLGSNSETRAKILNEHNIEFVQTGSDYDEDKIITDSPKSFVYIATLGKFDDIYKNYGLDIPILTSDTVVCTNDIILRKAKDIDDAKRLLDMQSDNIVSIITCMKYKSKDIEVVDISSTKYIFDKFDKSDIENYLESDLWQGKAGACMVEGFCKKYIKSVVGYQSCAMGLTIEKILPFLKK